MSVRALLEDAQALWTHGRKLGAVVLVLVTVSATSRKRYPKTARSMRDPSNKMGSGEAFKRFVLDEMDKVTGGPKYNVAFPFRGEEKVPLEDILWKHLRCQLEHEGAMLDSIYFTQPQDDGRNMVNVLKLTEPLGFGTSGPSWSGWSPTHSWMRMHVPHS